MPKNKDPKATTKTHPNLKPAQQVGLTITKADFETRRIQAMSAVATSRRRYENFWRAVNFGNRYMLAIALAALAANYQAEKVRTALNGHVDLACYSVIGLILLLGLSNLLAWYQLYNVMQKAMDEEAKVTQWQSGTLTENMSWLTKQHFLVHLLLMALAILFWVNALLGG